MAHMESLAPQLQGNKRLRACSLQGWQPCLSPVDSSEGHQKHRSPHMGLPKTKLHSLGILPSLITRLTGS